MKCKHCGAIIREGNRYCLSCGSKAVKKREWGAGRHKRRKIIFATGGALLLLVAVLAVLALTGMLSVVGSGKRVVDNNGIIQAGEYKVGVDLPAGEYYLVADGETASGGLFIVSSSADSENVEDIICTENFVSSVYVTVKNGQNFNFINSHAIASNKAKQENSAFLGEGMYKSGPDISPGKYDIYPMNGKNTYFGIYKIYQDSLYIGNSMVDIGYFDEASCFEIKEGQYIMIIDAYIEK